MITRAIAAVAIAIAAALPSVIPSTADATPGWVPDFARVVVPHRGLTVGEVVPVEWVTGPADGCPIIDRMCAYIEVDGRRTLVERSLEASLVPSGPDLDGTPYPEFAAEARLTLPDLGDALDRSPADPGAQPIYAPGRVWVSPQTVTVADSLAADGGTWVRVAWGLEDGWVHTDWLTPLGQPATAPEPTPEPTVSAEPEPEVTPVTAAPSLPTSTEPDEASWRPLAVGGALLAGIMLTAMRRWRRRTNEESR